MAERTPYEQIRDIRGTLVDHLAYLWLESPLAPDLTEAVVRRLLAPLGGPDARMYADRMYAATVERGGLDPEIESAVSALMAVMGHAFAREVRHLTDASLRRLGLETPRAGDSLTTAQREGVTGASGGSNRVPVTPCPHGCRDGLIQVDECNCDGAGLEPHRTECGYEPCPDHEPVRRTPARVYMEDGCPLAWVSDPLPGGVVCAVADPTKPDGMCGMPVESEPCSIHYPEAGDE